MTTKKKMPSAPGRAFTEKDADTLIAGYGRALTPEKKAALLARLGAERAAFEKGRDQTATKQGTRNRER